MHLRALDETMYIELTENCLTEGIEIGGLGVGDWDSGMGAAGGGLVVAVGIKYLVSPRI